ncbi:MAG: HAD hydrolase family protein [Candidatus Aminicenantes bacterium]|jgi:3-deoxy-D-manno-octulosonate 8-phosphate phosphatase (KDO 8-P phosphatase)|nr:HAD hydrolase family protein [Candidatus Aminicenantes bacterium]
MRNKARAGRVKMVLMDVDGTLTDGTLAVLPDGEEIKTYNVRDGMGVLLAQLAGLKLGIITGKISKGLEKRAERLKITEIYQGIIDKKKVLDEILEKNRLAAEDVAYIGDDLGDLEVIRSVGFSAAVADAHPIVKKSAHYVCKKKGGSGAFREFIEYIIGAQKKWEVITSGFKKIFDRKL